MTPESEKSLPIALDNSPILKRMVRHFKGAGATRHEIDLGDGDEPFVFYSEPMSMKDRADLGELLDIDPAVAFAEIIIRKCLDEAGKPVFQKDAKRWLLNSADPDTVRAIFDKVNRGVPSIEDAEKN